MAYGRFSLSCQALRRMLLLPDDYQIVSAQYDTTFGVIDLGLESSAIPDVSETSPVPDVKPTYAVQDGKPHLEKIEFDLHAPFPVDEDEQARLLALL